MSPGKGVHSSYEHTVEVEEQYQSLTKSYHEERKRIAESYENEERAIKLRLQEELERMKAEETSQHDQIAAEGDAKILAMTNQIRSETAERHAMVDELFVERKSRKYSEKNDAIDRAKEKRDALLREQRLKLVAALKEAQQARVLAQTETEGNLPSTASPPSSKGGGTSDYAPTPVRRPDAMKFLILRSDISANLNTRIYTKGQSQFHLVS